MQKTVILIGILFYSINAFTQDTVKVSDFGIFPDSRINAVPMVQKALEVCRTLKNPVLFFPKGRYDFWSEYSTRKVYFESNTDVIPERICPILVGSFDGLTIDCDGSDFIYHGSMQPFTFDKCRNVRLQNVNIDWDIPLTAQAQVVDTSDDHVDIAINVMESPYIIENGKIFFVGEGWKSKMWEWGVIEFDKETKLIPQNSGDNTMGRNFSKYTAQELEYGLVRLKNKFTRKPAVGNYLVLRHSFRDHAGIFLTDSRNITIQNLNMYQTSGLGILSQYSEDLFFKNVNFIPNAAKNRYFSGHDDGLHFSNCRGQIIVDSCRFQCLMDDPINIHGTCVRVVEKSGDKKLLCRFMHDQSKGFRWANSGDSAGFINSETMNTFAHAIIESFTTRTIEDFELTFKDILPENVTAGTVIENLTWTPDATIKNNYFASNRARGILISTPGKVIIENNIFESSGSAILIAGDANGWYESGAVKDVVIRNNLFKDACNATYSYQFCEAIISIFPIIPKLSADKPFHRNIRIENNTFHPFDYPVLYALSVDGLTFSQNRLIRSTMYQPSHNRKATVTLEACKNVQISGNILEGDILGKNIVLINTKRSDLKSDKNQGLIIEKK
jgi:hypothetical protein